MSAFDDNNNSSPDTGDPNTGCLQSLSRSVCFRKFDLNRTHFLKISDQKDCDPVKSLIERFTNEEWTL